MKKQTIIPILIFIFVIANAAAQDSQIIIQLIDYNPDTQVSKVHIQNNAGFDLNELDFYVNSIRTGRVSEKLADGKAILYFQTLTYISHNLLGLTDSPGMICSPAYTCVT